MFFDLLIYLLFYITPFSCIFLFLTEVHPRTKTTIFVIIIRRQQQKIIINGMLKSETVFRMSTNGLDACCQTTTALTLYARP